MAYARAFLDDSKANQLGSKKVKDLKDIFRYPWSIDIFYCYLFYEFVDNTSSFQPTDFPIFKFAPVNNCQFDKYFLSMFEGVLSRPAAWLWT